MLAAPFIFLRLVEFDRLLRQKLGEREPSFTISDIFAARDDPELERARRRAMWPVLAGWAVMLPLVFYAAVTRQRRKRRD